MCLVLERKYRKCIAKTDIVVYKHLLRNTKTKAMLTSYRKFPVEIGSSYSSKFKIHKYDATLDLHDEISVGLHSFRTLKACREDGNLEKRWKTNDETEMVICRCVIPKGSEYYVGKFCYEVCYASNQITYLEIIETLV